MRNSKKKILQDSEKLLFYLFLPLIMRVILLMWPRPNKDYLQQVKINNKIE
jgi:hypothetical protein